MKNPQPLTHVTFSSLTSGDVPGRTINRLSFTESMLLVAKCFERRKSGEREKVVSVARR